MNLINRTTQLKLLKLIQILKGRSAKPLLVDLQRVYGLGHVLCEELALLSKQQLDLVQVREKLLSCKVCVLLRVRELVGVLLVPVESASLFNPVQVIELLVHIKQRRGLGLFQPDLAWVYWPLERLSEVIQDPGVDLHFLGGSISIRRVRTKGFSRRNCPPACPVWRIYNSANK